MTALQRLILTSLLALFLSPFATYAQTREESMMETARQHASSGEYYFATTWLERILINYPGTPHRKEVLLLMAKAYAASGRDEKASQTLRMLLKDYPEVAGSLDAQLLKLAGDGHPTEPASPKVAAPPELTEKAAVSLPPVEPATAPPASVPAPQMIPESPQPLPTPVVEQAPARSVEPAPARSMEQAPTPRAEQANVAVMAKNADDTKKYTLKFGEYVLLPAMADAKKMIKDSGLLPVVIPGPKKVMPMIRLSIVEYTDQKSALKELDRLRKAKVDGFMLMNRGKYHVYAGSYFDRKGAALEQRRLASLGIKSNLQKKSVPVPTFLLTAGSFPTREAALEGAMKLGKQGGQAVVMEIGK